MFDSRAAIAFWCSGFLLAYAYVLYPLGVWVIAKRRTLPIRPEGDRPQSASFLLSVRNEAAHIERRLAELTAMLSATVENGEVIVVSDGSSDSTASIVAGFGDPRVRLVEWNENRGKAAAITHAASLAGFEVLVLADCRQRWEPDALALLLEDFRDPSVGAVSGELVLETCDGVLAGVGLYWRFEKWLRSRESAIHSQIGVTGAIAAVRRERFRPIPPDTLLDDVYWPMMVVLDGKRVVHERRAIAYDRLPPTTAGELRRKIRTLVGNFQLVTLAPELLAPWRNPIWLPFVSHKLLRLVAPWAMIVTAVGSVLAEGVVYRIAFAAQALFLGMAIWGLASKQGGQQRVPAAAGSFLLLHVAAWLAFWSWATGGSARVWRRSQFAAPPAEGTNAT